MQLSLPLAGTTTPAPAAIEFVRHRRARRYVLRVLADGRLRVTLPRWGVKREAMAFVDASRAWIDRQHLRRRVAARADRPWRDGTRLLVEGVEMSLRTEPTAEGLVVWCGDRLVTTTDTVGDLRAIVRSWLQDRARRELPGMLLHLARVHDIDVPRVSVRDQRSRWGACSPSGTITLNWRLIQTPPHVREYVLIHELMHRRELNHSRRFWRLVAECCPRHADARQWLRTEGKALWSDRG